jgi:phasin family protein
MTMQNEMLEMANKLAEESYAAMKKLNETNVKTMQALFDHQMGMMNNCLTTAMTTAEKLATVKDVKQAVELQLELAKECSEKSLGNFNEVVEMMNAARDEYSALIEENVQAAEKNVKQAAKVRKAA